MKDEEQIKRDDPTKEVLSDLPVTEEQAIKTNGGGGGSDDCPTEEINFSYGRINFNYSPTK